MLSFPRRLFSVLALSTLLTFQVHAANSSDASTVYSKLPPFKSGLWWSDQASGHGLDLQFIDDIVFVVIYTYDAEGEPIWYTAEAPLNNHKLDTQFMRHRWDNTDDKYLDFVREGRLQLEVQNAYRIKASIELNGGTRELELTPFAQSNISEDEPKTGLWYNPDKSGYGFTYVQQQRWKFGLYYFYDEEGKPTWLYGANDGHKEEISFQRFQGSCLSCEQKASIRSSAGSATFSFTGAMQGNINIQLNDDSSRWALKDSPIRMLTQPESARPSFHALSRFESDTALADYLRQGYTNLGREISYSYDFSPAPIGPAATSSSSVISSTNVQEKGVDEIDYLKADPQCAFTYPSEEDFTISSYALDSDGKIGERKQFTKDPLVFSDTITASNSSNDLGLYLTEQQLASINTAYVSHHEDAWVQDELWRKGYTFVDVHQREACELKEYQRITLSGNAISTRRIGKHLYIMWRGVPSLDRSLLDQLAAIEIDKLVPKIRINDQDWQPAVDHNNSYVLADQELPATNFMLLTRINLEQPDDVKTISVAGQTETVYVSTNAAYFASNANGYRIVNDTTNHFYSYAYSTQIHKINLDEELSYAGSGSVDGYLEGNSEVSPFRLSERNGDLAVVTRYRDQGRAAYKLSILTPSKKQKGLLVYRSYIPNKKRPEYIGKLNESLEATRFVDDKMYAVTFRRIDPLYVVNLSDHDDPYIQGVLEVPGFSSYLHPLPNDKLLGVGQAADDQGRDLGNQVSLFDISNPEVPALIKNIVIGAGGSNSAVQRSHHGFSYLPGDNARNARFAIPMVLQKRVSTGSGTQIEWDSSGLYQFEFNSDFTDMNVTQDLTTHKFTGNYQNDNQVKNAALNGRSTLFENQLIYYEGGRLWGAKWGDKVPDYVPSGD
ncbi:beta-propeller domain-containing protein [Pseudoteredinibacter isoporae]|uniref:Putative secreted protein with C-terminal beta-propeller domain n=1 Tax=Pseudoteredinibacter isoporae TaxID=570281 RepID=A0A7X0JU95_9GAMM|nr:beta-propeller domain-containing protein [Pseudoteredinibacter isoporae]MBB6521813.1 putative secreted protein with C-terminal beta-propeller domain [Pseudoteredinibacter isoporae]NHO87358.1 hypothetical protein [Pseudoteredinibacter isoporae]NIB23182.1 hypothetical protein [Pseudoteredinibacter isoporae]